MKKIIRLFSILFIFVLVFSFTSCSGSGEQKYKSAVLNQETAEHVELVNITDFFKQGQTVTPLEVNALPDAESQYIFIGYFDALTNTIYLNGAVLPDTANTLTYSALYVKSTLLVEGKSNYAFVGFLVEDPEDASNKQLYTNKSSLVYNEQQLIFVEYDDEGNIPFPTVNVDGTNFSGWYADAEYKSGSRVANIEALANIESFNGVIYARFLGYGEAAIVSVVCILIVFSMLALLWLIVSLLKHINKLNKPKAKEEAKQEQVNVAPVLPKQPLKLEDIKDDDMMAAALVATIDYHEETKEDVRVVSIKEIK